MTVTGADLADVELQRRIARDRADTARCLAPGLKLIVGARLFDVVRRRMLAGIRDRHPNWPLAEIEMEFRRQLAMLRQREDQGVFTPVEPQ